MLYRRLGTLAFIFSLITTAFPQPAQQRFTLTGIVRNASGAAVENANVELSVGAEKIQFTVTNDAGNFSFNKIPPGTYQLGVEYPGFESVKVCVDVADRSPIPIEVVLTRSRTRQNAIGTESNNGQRGNNTCGQSLDGSISSRDAETLSRFAFDLLGIVQRTNGDIIVSAAAELRSSGLKVQSAVSDESGNYRFEEVHPGQYKVHVESPGFEPADIPFKVGYSDPGRMWITLHESITVTGCLAPSGQRDLFVITDESGKVYLVKSLNVPLKDHVGHKITITGAIGDIDDDDDWTG